MIVVVYYLCDSCAGWILCLKENFRANWQQSKARVGYSQWSIHFPTEYIRIDLQLSQDRDGKCDSYMSQISDPFNGVGRYNNLLLRVELEKTLPCPTLWFYSISGNDAMNRLHLFNLIQPPSTLLYFPFLLGDRVTTVNCLLQLGEVMLLCHVRIGSSMFMLPSSMRLTCHEPPVVRYKLSALLHPSVLKAFNICYFSGVPWSLFCVICSREEQAEVFVFTHINSPPSYLSLLYPSHVVQVQFSPQLMLMYMLTSNFWVWKTLNLPLAVRAHMVWRTLNRGHTSQVVSCILRMYIWKIGLDALNLRDLVSSKLYEMYYSNSWIYFGMDSAHIRIILAQRCLWRRWLRFVLSCFRFGFILAESRLGQISLLDHGRSASVIFGLLNITNVLDRIIKSSTAFVWDVTCNKLLMFAGSLQPP